MQEEQTERMSPFVGHVYQIQFNAWTYAKSNLWASLMQEVFYELNRQITLEQKLGRFLSENDVPSTSTEPSTSLLGREKHYTSYKYLNYYILRHYRFFKYFFCRLLKNRIFKPILSVLSFFDLAILQPIFHLVVFIFISFFQSFIFLF